MDSRCGIADSYDDDAEVIVREYLSAQIQHYLRMTGHKFQNYEVSATLS
jgi:hypothetical protein